MTSSVRLAGAPLNPKETNVSDRYKSREAVAGKIEWEGGIFEALDYGIKTEHMPEGDTEMAEAWKALSDAYRALQPLVDKVDALLDAEETP